MTRREKIKKSTPFTAEMAEVYFRTIQVDFISLREEMNSKFTAVYKRFDQVDKRFEKVDKRFDQMDKRFDQMDKRFEKVDKRFNQMDNRFGKVESVLSGVLKTGQNDKLEREEIKLNLWENGRKIANLQKQLA